MLKIRNLKSEAEIEENYFLILSKHHSEVPWLARLAIKYLNYRYVCLTNYETQFRIDQAQTEITSKPLGTT